MLAFLFIFLFSLLKAAQIQVIGNLAVVAYHKDHVSSPKKELTIRVAKLWCAAQNSETKQETSISFGHFIRADGNEIDGKIQGKRLLHEAGNVPSSTAGKYKCELKTNGGETVYGNLFVYMAPVLHFSSAVPEVKEIPNVRPPRVVGATISANKGGRITLKCPAFGFPKPFVHWEKDGKAIEGGEYKFTENDLTIASVKPSHAGIYNCIADNSFPIFVGGPAIAHQLIYEQNLIVH